MPYLENNNGLKTISNIIFQKVLRIIVGLIEIFLQVSGFCLFKRYKIMILDALYLQVIIYASFPNAIKINVNSVVIQHNNKEIVP